MLGPLFSYTNPPSFAHAQNGVAAFILPLKRLDFHYCDWAGSSRGMKYVLFHSMPLSLAIPVLTIPSAFLRTLLPRFVSQHPSVETTVSPRPHAHPIIRATYINGREKVICVRNLEPREVMKKAELLRDAGGEKLRRVTGVVESQNQSVRGVWSGLHDVIKEKEMAGKGESSAWRI